jgi:RNA polymerase sigma-70 factor (ECF subfamily)
MPENDAYILKLIPNTAFERLMQKYERLMYYIARRYFSSNEDAADACQESAIRIFKGLPTVKLPESGSLKSWVCAVTTNTCVDLLRKKRVATTTIPEGEVTYQAEPSAEETAMGRERIRDIMAAMEKLPDDHRTIIILRDMNGLSYQEIAETVGINEGTVKSRLSRARTALKNLLEQAV